MENHHFFIGKPSINGPSIRTMAMLNNQRVIIIYSLISHHNCTVKTRPLYSKCFAHVEPGKCTLDLSLLRWKLPASSINAATGLGENPHANDSYFQGNMGPVSSNVAGLEIHELNWWPLRRSRQLVSVLPNS